ncbi:MAG: VOC family protein [Anaerolineae bacterium]
MAGSINTGGVHHVTITVTDVERSRAFYEQILGFQKVGEFGPRAIMFNGAMRLVLTPPPDPAQAIRDDRFNENRVGLDHLSIAVESREELERAVDLFDQEGVEHGEIKDMGQRTAIYVLAFRDPDNIQLELTAPYAAG